MSAVLLEDLPAVAAAIVRWTGGASLEWWDLLNLEADTIEARGLLAKAKAGHWTADDAARLIGLVAAASAEAEVRHQLTFASMTDEDVDYEAWQLETRAAAVGRRPGPKPWVKPSERIRRRAVALATAERNKLDSNQTRTAAFEKYRRLMSAGTRSPADALRDGWPSSKSERDRVRRWLKATGLL